MKYIPNITPARAITYTYIYIYYIPPPLTVHFSMTHSVRYQLILHTLYYTLHTEHAYCLSYRFFNNVVIPTVIELVEMVEILDGRLGKRSVERVKYVVNNLLHLVIVKYGDISLVLCISTRLRLVTILSLLMKYLVILHADPCNKSYIYIIYIYTDTNPITLPCSLARAGKYDKTFKREAERNRPRPRIERALEYNACQQLT